MNSVRKLLVVSAMLLVATVVSSSANANPENGIHRHPPVVVGLPAPRPPVVVGLPVPRPPIVVGLPAPRPPRPIGIIAPVPPRPPVVGIIAPIPPRPPVVGIVVPFPPHPPVGLPVPPRPRSIELNCFANNQNQSGIRRLRLDLTQIAPDTFRANGSVRYFDGYEDMINTTAVGTLYGQVRLDLYNVGDLNLRYIGRVAAGELAGRVNVYNRLDQYGLSCDLNRD